LEVITVSITVVKEQSAGTRRGGGGYAELSSRTIYIDPKLKSAKKILVILHEVLELDFPEVRHSRLDRAAIDIIDALQQTKVLRS
jgi:uncharacterized membrane protein